MKVWGQQLNFPIHHKCFLRWGSNYRYTHASDMVTIAPTR